jgi:hypothetical protein
MVVEFIVALLHLLLKTAHSAIILQIMVVESPVSITPTLASITPSLHTTQQQPLVVASMQTLTQTQP